MVLRNIWILNNLLFLTFLDPSAGIAQSVEKIVGSVYSVTGEPLEGANIMVVGSGIGAASDSRGRFVLENLFTGEYTLRITHVGYLEEVLNGVIVGAEQPAQLVFRLQPTVLTLPGVLFEAPRTSSNINYNAIIKRDEIQASNARTVTDLLVNLPGVEVIENGPEARISIRGSNPNQVLVLLDGVSVNNPSTGYADLSDIPLSWVEEIRVAKGGMSATHGGGALGGVVEVVTRRPVSDEYRIDSHIGSFDDLGVAPSISGNLKGIRYFLSLEYRTEQGDFPYAYSLLDGSVVHENRINAAYDALSYAAKLSRQFGAHRVQVQANVHNSERGLPGQIQAWSPFAHARTHRHLIAARYDFDAARTRTTLQLSRYQNWSEFENSPPPEPPLKFRAVPPYHTSFDVVTHLLTAELDETHGSRQKKYVKASVQHDDFEDKNHLSQSPGSTGATQNLSAGLAAGGRWYWPKAGPFTRISMRPQARVDWIRLRNEDDVRMDIQFSPSLYLIANIGIAPVVTLTMGGGRSFRTPTFSDLFFQDFRVRGNASLLPEKSFDLEAGLRLDLASSARLVIESSVFRNEIENLVAWELGSFATYQPRNTNALLRGIESSLEWYAARNMLKFEVAHTYLDAVNKSGQRTTHNKQLTYRPSHSVKVRVRFSVSRLALEYARRMSSSRFVTAANTVELPGYHVDDLTASLQTDFGPIRWLLKLSVFNLLDQRYEIVENTPVPGRHWRIGLQVSKK